MGVRGLACAVATAIATAACVLVPATAAAAPPTGLTASESGGVITASWKLPAGTNTGWFELSPNTDSDDSGAYTDAGAVPIQFYDGTTRYRAATSLAPGTYYAHVSAIRAECDDIEIQCVNEWSKPVLLKVGGSGGPADTSTSFKLLKVAARQRVGRIVVRAAMPESGTIAVRGALSVPGAAKAYRLKAVSAAAPAGKTVTLRVKLARKAARAAKRALARHAKVKAKLTITARDAAGNTKVAKRTVALRR